MEQNEFAMGVVTNKCISTLFCPGDIIGWRYLPMDKAVCSVVVFQYRHLEQRRIRSGLFSKKKKKKKKNDNSPNRVSEQNSCQIICRDYINK